MPRTQKISVIIPVYNASNYLKQCLNSILSQNYKNLEIILVDDGSTDSSYGICKDYERKDKRIKVFKQENRGPGTARNLALSKATGDWLSFVDSDDVLEDRFYEKLLSHGEDYNIICSGVRVLFDVENQQTQSEINFYNNANKFDGKNKVDYAVMSQINTELWNKLFKKSILDQYNITFKSGAFEDGDILFRVLAVSPYIYFDNSVNYFYRRHSQSIVEDLSHGIIRENYNVISGSIEEVERLYNFCKENDILENHWKFLLFLLHRNYHFVLSQISESQKIEYKQKISDFLENYVPNSIIDRYATDVGLLYNLKCINVFKPFHVPQIDTKIKIAVCYHKPSLLPEKDNKVFFPIHLGRSLNTNTKDGGISQENTAWLHQNMIGDDTGDNISKENRKYCELTAIYWAWKNYEKIGTPDYFGLCHYRRIFNLYDQKIDADVYIVPVWRSPTNAQLQYKDFHKTNEMELALEIISSDYPEYEKIAIEYYNDNKLHLYNMFIMKKDIFFQYAQWLFEILSKIDKKIDYGYRNYQSLRALAYLAERLQDIYVRKLEEDGYNVKEMPLLLPEEKFLAIKPIIQPKLNDAKVIVTACDDNYILYAGTMITSIISNVQKDEKYELYILDGGISQLHKNKIQKLERKNFQINFIDMNHYLSRYGELFKTTTHFTPATYFRFFIPEIFTDCDKVLYLDPDMIIDADVRTLFDIDLGDNLLAACRDVEAERKTYEMLELQKYFYEKLRIENIHNYFQAGVMVFNIQEMKKNKFMDRCLTLLKEIGNPMWVDQDVMNSVAQNKVHFLKPEWNYGFFLLLDNLTILNGLDHRIYDVMRKVEQNPYIIHFCGGPKPWNNPTLPFAEKFWYYARMTPFYEEILFKHQTQLPQAPESTVISKEILGEAFHYTQNKIKYWRYKILSKLFWGKKRKIYMQKRKDMKMRLKAVRQFLR